MSSAKIYNALDGAPLSMHLLLLNYNQLSVCYGHAVSSGVVREVQGFFFSIGATIYSTDRDSFCISFPGEYIGFERHLEEWFTRISTHPIVYEGVRVLPIISLALVSADTLESYKSCSVECGDRHYPVLINAARYCYRWRAAYEADMDICVDAVDQFNSAKAYLCRQPIQGISRKVTLYEEALLRFEPMSGARALDLGRFFEAVSNIGFHRTVDQYVVNDVLKQLRAEPDAIIGCNISVGSCRLDFFWMGVIEQLKLSPCLANRLVFEITEGDPVVDVNSVLDFFYRFQSLGCKFALDDLGAGASRSAIIGRGRFEYIKIDKSLLHQARLSYEQKMILKHTVDLFGHYSPNIILEGVETHEDFSFAVYLGVSGGQGFYIGVPEVKKKILFD